MKTMKAIKVEIFPSPYNDAPSDFYTVRFQIEVENYGEKGTRKFGGTEVVHIDDFKSRFEQLFDGAKHIIKTAIIEEDFKNEKI